MATDVAPEIAKASEPPAVRSGMRRYRLTVEQYLKMIDVGIFGSGAHVELLGGVLVEKMTKNDPHDLGVSTLGEAIRRLLPDGWCVREEKSMNLDRWSRPEPDIVVARGALRDFARRAPTPTDVPLVIEVANSSYERDRGANWRRYASAEIPAYGILNILQRRLEFYRKPEGKGRGATYQESTIYDENAEFPVVIDGRELGRIAVKDLLA